MWLQLEAAKGKNDLFYPAHLDQNQVTSETSILGCRQGSSVHVRFHTTSTLSCRSGLGKAAAQERGSERLARLLAQIRSTAGLGLTCDWKAFTRLLPPRTKCGAPRLEIVALPVVLNDGTDRLPFVVPYGSKTKIGKAIRYGRFDRNQNICVSARYVLSTTTIATIVSPVRHGFRKNWTDWFSGKYKKSQFVIKAPLIGASIPKGIQAKSKGSCAI